MDQLHDYGCLGKIYGCVGNMGGGKSHRLIGMTHIDSIQEEGVLFLQPIESCRTRPDQAEARSHARFEGAIAIEHPSQILTVVAAHRARNIFMDEVHFYGKTPERLQAFKHAILTLRKLGYNVYWSGLLKDFKRDTFEATLFILGETDDGEWHQPECKICHVMPAPWPQRLRFGQPVPRNDPLFVPDTEDQNLSGYTYEARCGLHHVLPDEPNEYLQAIYRAIAQAAEKKTVTG